MKVRKEVHSRQSFAYERAEYWLKRINAAQRGGNILTCKWTTKFMQARRIYIHYANEFQIAQNLPLSIYHYLNKLTMNNRKQMRDAAILYFKTERKEHTQYDAEKLFDEWLRLGKFTKNGLTYTRGVNEDSAIKAMIPDNRKMVGAICYLPSQLTLTNTDLDSDYHKGFTINSGKIMYWYLVWYSTGHCRVYDRDGKKPRYVKGDTIITIHFK